MPSEWLPQALEDVKIRHFYFSRIKFVGSNFAQASCSICELISISCPWHLAHFKSDQLKIKKLGKNRK